MNEEDKYVLQKTSVWPDNIIDDIYLRFNCETFFFT